MVVFGNKGKGGKFSINFMAGLGLPGIKKGYAVSATLDQDALVFACRLPGINDTVRLSYEKIDAYSVITGEEIETINKSVFGRAFVGGLLLGHFGAVLGAIDGAGTKQRKSKKKYVVIGYTSNGEKNTVMLEVVGATLGLDKFERLLSEAALNMEIVNVAKEIEKAEKPTQTTL